MNSAIATTNNLRPEQKLQDHTEYPRHEDQFPSARTHPSPDRLPRSLESPQHVIREKEKASQRRQLVTIPAMLLADRDFGCAVVSERKPDESDGQVQNVWPMTAHNGSKTRHHHQCLSTVSLSTAKPRQRNPDQ